jgi:4-amino-4-deoxy-L-arabinose transferase-like glycosyltransferase
VDEIVTYLSSRGTLGYVLTQRDVNSNIPPLYYVTVNAALRAGDAVGLADQDALLRLPSVLFGVLSIPFLFLVLQPLLGRSVASQAAIMMAISPFHVWYSQEARPYALLILLSLVALWCLQKALAQPGSLAWRGAFAISAAAVAYCHTVGVAFLAFLMLYVLLRTTRGEWTSWAMTFGVTAFLLLPAGWRLYTFPPLESANPEYSFSPIHVVYGIWTFATGYSLGPSLGELHRPDRGRLLLHHLPLILPILAFFAILGLGGAKELWQRSRAVLRILLLWFVIPMAFAIVGSLVTVHPFNVRYGILSYPPFIAAIALGTEGLRARRMRSIAWLAIFVVSVVSLYGYLFLGRYSREDTRAAGQFLRAYAMPGDVVIASAPQTTPTLTYYYRDTSAAIIGYPTKERYVEPSRIEADLATILHGRDRFWLFQSRTYQSDPNDDLGRYCDQHFQREKSLDGNGIRMILYRKTL